jgi:hypothetical protein
VVTQADYDALQDSLNRKYSDRDLEALSPRHSDNKEDRVDDDDDLEASNEVDSEINPFTLSYLDPSTLELKNKSGRFPFPLFLRQEYDHISELIRKRPRNSKGSVIISGQPGTGEVAESNQPCRYQGKTAYDPKVEIRGVSLP